MTVFDDAVGVVTYTYGSGNDDLVARVLNDGSSSNFGYDGTWRRATSFVWTEGLVGSGLAGFTPSFGAHPDETSLTAGLVPSGTSAGLETSFLNPDGSRTTFTWSDGRITGIEGPLGGMTSFTYGGAGGRDLTLVEYVGGGRVTVGYDGSGRPNVVRDLLDRRTTYQYDAAGRVEALAAPGGQSASWGFDEAGHVTTSTSASNLLAVVDGVEAVRVLMKKEAEVGRGWGRRGDREHWDPWSGRL